MRFIRTTNSQIEFIEANDNGQILNSIGLQLGEVYFQIKNGKVAFYLNDSEKPFDNFIWSTNIPLMIDDEVYETEDEVSEALHSIMNDSFQEQLDKLKEDLAAESARAEEAEAQLDDKIDDETSRAVSAETHLQDEITALSGTVATFDERITRNTNDISALTNTVNAEIARSTGKDAEHDAAISGLTNSLNNEISRATSAETSLHNEILAETNRAQVAESGITANLNTEIQNRIADVDAEEARAIAAESGITANLNAEVTRSTAKDASHDAEISGLTTSLQNEINRAVGAENSLRDDLNDEVSARTSADAAQLQRITALEVGKADANNVYTKAESDAKYATKDYISGLTDNFYTKGQTNELLAAKADKVSAVASAIYNSTNKTIDFKNISGTVISSVDARDFIKDGMVDTVSISGTNLVITFNTDAGKEDIIVPLTDIFDPSNYYTKAETDEAIADAIDDIDLSNYYTKSEVDASQTAQDNKINAISGDVQTLSGKVDTISGDVVTLGGNIQTLSGEVQTISGDVQTISGKVDDMKTYVGGRGITIATGKTADTISFNLPISAGTGSNSIIEGYKTKTGAFSSYSHAEGYSSTTVGNYSHAEGIMTKATGDFSHAEGSQTEAKSVASHAEGLYTSAATPYSFVCGLNGIASGDSAIVEDTNTIFAIGNGLDDTHKTTRVHNAFEVKLNGDIYISSGGTRQSPMIKLQDALAAAGGSGVTSGEVQTMIDDSIRGKANSNDVYLKTETSGKTEISNALATKLDATAYTPTDLSNYYTKSETSGKTEIQTALNGKTNQSDFNTHSGNTTVHITSAERSTWNAKPSVWSGTEQQWAAISGGTLDNNTIYLIY